MLECIKCTPEHIEQLKPRLREADRIELTLATGKSPEEALDDAIHLSTESYVWVERGVVLCVFGVVQHPEDTGVGIPWLMASDEAVTVGKRLVRHCGKKIEELSVGYRLLFNMVYQENRVAIRWLQWCGFTFSSPVPCGPSSAMFLPFYKNVEVNHV